MHNYQLCVLHNVIPKARSKQVFAQFTNSLVVKFDF